MDSVVNLEKDGKKFSYNTKDIFHYLNADECKDGIEGYGGNSIKELNENIVNGNVRYLGQILDMDFSYTRFMVNETEDREDEEYLLFLPLKAVKTTEPEPKLVPFRNFIDFCVGTNLKIGDTIYLRLKRVKDSEHFPYMYLMLEGYYCTADGHTLVKIGNVLRPLEELFNDFEYSKNFQEWKPFSREVA